jgi:sulfane dehydrogenase subunit SoxC
MPWIDSAANPMDEASYHAARADELLWRRARQHRISRRRLFQLVAMGASSVLLQGGWAWHPRGVQAASPGDLVLKPTPPEQFFDYGSNKEMRWEQLYPRGYVVPNELFFVRNHTRTPRIEVSTWRLRIEGSGVQRPLELTYDELLAMPSISVLRAIECAGNGRSFFEAAYGKKPQGTQWKLGAIGVAEWTGVPLSTILDRAGLKRSARDVMPQGLDDLLVRRPMSITKALAEDTILAYAMNGEPLPPDHGFPVRVLTPGWIGVANVKWVGRIEVSEEALYSHWNTETYVLIGPDYPLTPPAQGAVLSSQSIKSALELAREGAIPAGRHLIRGRSWSPFGKIAGVDYSLDQGETWRQARLREPNIARAWVRWDFDWEAAAGRYIIQARATDAEGHTQPDRVPWNDQGYLYNAVVDHPVTVT